MKIPKYIDRALRLRTKFAVALMKYCWIVDNFLDNNGISGTLEDYDIHTGCEIYCNPYDSEERVRAAIEDFQEQDDI